MRPLVVGERRNESDGREWTPESWARVALRRGAFDDRDAAKLSRIGLDLSSCDRLNLCPPAPQSEPWDAAFAREVAALLARTLARRPVVYLAGGRVLVALGVCREGNPLAELYGQTVTTISGSSAIAIPHPSGLNRWWNDPRRSSRLRDLMTSTVLGGTVCRRS